ncbi:MAG: hypothetical protein RLY70_2981 [Planctomycetota bacterium]
MADSPRRGSTDAAPFASLAGDCPSVTTFAALLQGTVAGPDELLLTGHLESCEACRKRLERLAAGEQFPGEVARRLPGIEQTPAPLAALMEQFADPPDWMATRVGQDESTAGIRLAISWPDNFPRVGAKLDRYQLLREIGRGGMGVVFAARDVTLDRLVAVKVLAPQWLEDKTARQRFSAEARAAAAVNSRYVVTIHAVEDRGDWPYLVMEYLAGCNLQQLLDTRGPLPVSAIAHIGMRVAMGLAAAHERGLVHRDVKPANVLVMADSGQVKLTDFGLARAGSDSRLTEAGMLVGTLAYMAPEQLEGQPIDCRVDLYGLGCVLYAMGAGRPPINGDNSLAIMRGVLAGKIPPLASLRPQLPAALVSLVEQLLAREPANRLGSAAEAARQLKLIRGSTGTKVESPDHVSAHQWPPGTTRALDEPASAGSPLAAPGRKGAAAAAHPMAPFVGNAGVVGGAGVVGNAGVGGNAGVVGGAGVVGNAGVGGAVGVPGVAALGRPLPPPLATGGPVIAPAGLNGASVIPPDSVPAGLSPPDSVPAGVVPAGVAVLGPGVHVSGGMPQGGAGPSPDAWPADFAAAEFFGSGWLPPDYLPPECGPTGAKPVAAPLLGDGSNAVLMAVAESPSSASTLANTSSPLVASHVEATRTVSGAHRPAPAVRRSARRSDNRLQTSLLAGCGGLTLLLIVVVVVTGNRGGPSATMTGQATGQVAGRATGQAAAPVSKPVFDPTAGPGTAKGAVMAKPAAQGPFAGAGAIAGQPPGPWVGNFVEVQSLGVTPRWFQDLRTAIESAPSHSELLLRGGGLWRTPPLDIRGKELRIRAASPREGRIHFIRDANHVGPLLRTDSSLVLEGLTLIDDGASPGLLEWPGGDVSAGGPSVDPRNRPGGKGLFNATQGPGVIGPDGSGPSGGGPSGIGPNGIGPSGKGLRSQLDDSIVLVVGARLILDRCRLGTARRAACVWIDGAEQVEVRQCQLAAPAGMGMAYRDLQPFTNNRPRTLRLEDTTTLSRVGLFLDIRPDPRGEIKLSNCLFLGESALHLELPRVFETLAAGPAMTIDSRQVVFDCDALMTLWTRVAEGPLERVRAAESLPRRVVWRGEANRLQPNIQMLLLKPMSRFSSPASVSPPTAALTVADLDAWRRFWPSAESFTQLREFRYGPAQVDRAKLSASVPSAPLPMVPGEIDERGIERLERSVGLHPLAEITLQ